MSKVSSFLILITIFLFSCDSSFFDESKTLPKGRGEPGEILLVLDSAKWNSRLGEELRATFGENIEGLPREQPMFDLRKVAPYGFKTILKNAKNLVLVIPLYDDSGESQRMKNFFTPVAIDSLIDTPGIFILKRKNLFATDQQVLFLIGHSEAELIDKIIEYRDYMRKYFNDAEENRAVRKIYAIKEEKIISGKILRDHNFHIRVPYMYKVAIDSAGFVWLRQPGQDIDKNIFISYKPYTNTEEFSPDRIIEWTPFNDSVR